VHWGFSAAASGVPLTSVEAWSAALSYTFQIYFDFSGYSDMAIGLSRMFGIRLPLNFDSPYKAANITDFWRRWHMTLSRFLRDYLYIPLGGNRKGPTRRYINLLTTMVLGGLWHGAGWTFVAWGALHGAYLCINHVWTALRTKLAVPRAWFPVERAIGWLMTFLAVVFAWVFFRANSWSTAWSVCAAMVGEVPSAATLFNALAHPMQRLPGVVTNLGGLDLLRIVVLFGIAMLLPNSQQWLDRFHPALARAGHAMPEVLQWRPHWAMGMVAGVVAAVCVSMISADSAFLYFNF
jgi:D-alanyl-lipoteichoic acid acyltransferase DltB (MBOAT superfamily)